MKTRLRTAGSDESQNIDALSVLADAAKKAELIGECSEKTISHFGKLDILINNACIVCTMRALFPAIWIWDVYSTDVIYQISTEPVYATKVLLCLRSLKRKCSFREFLLITGTEAQRPARTKRWCLFIRLSKYCHDGLLWKWHVRDRSNELWGFMFGR